ncbi:hypothetical protein GCM10020367_52100 [Streptomyces sannanensis]|uniref:Uncharacterized protein n=1 Tax=Streptomyces sannanensis TaxID=285536 RepID=A0ABP6SI13_9ACTN
MRDMQDVTHAALRVRFGTIGDGHDTRVPPKRKGNPQESCRPPNWHMRTPLVQKDRGVQVLQRRGQQPGHRRVVRRLAAREDGEPSRWGPKEFTGLLSSCVGPAPDRGDSQWTP